MPLTGSQIKRIQDALLAAFDRNELRRVLRICMEASLDAITSDKLPFRTQVFELIEWADRNERVVEMLRCLHEDRPNDATLAALYTEAQGRGTPAAATPPAALQPPAPAAPAPAVPANDEAQQPAPALLSPQARVLVARMQDTAQPPAARLEAGLRADALGALPPDLDAFIPVPGLRVRIGKYPVTNSQFKRFVDAGGYAPENEERWWSSKGIEYKRGEGWTKPRFWYDPKYNHATQPVVGVSWYEAEAYCNWLSEARTGLRDDEYARLPTVAEWEAAARGGKPEPADDAQDYPWRGPFKPELANTKESNLQQTTPVHMYPTGATSQSVYDLIGNVWEWTTEPVEGYADAYWLVGGSWYNKAMPISAARTWFNVRNWIVNLGFRVVAVPGLS